MSARYFCDACGDELDETNPDRVSRRIIRKFGKVQVEVITGLVPVWNAGHLCSHCVVNAIVEGDDAS